METQELAQHIDKRLDKIEAKLDNHLDRLSKNEAEISSVRGSIRIVITILIAAGGFVITSLYNLLTGKG